MALRAVRNVRNSNTKSVGADVDAVFGADVEGCGGAFTDGLTAGAGPAVRAGSMERL